MDNLKTESKSREILPGKGFLRASPRGVRGELLEQEDYEIGGKVVEQVETMTSLPESACSFYDLKRIQSSRSLLCSPERLSPLRSLPKHGRR